MEEISYILTTRKIKMRFFSLTSLTIVSSIAAFVNRINAPVNALVNGRSNAIISSGRCTLDKGILDSFLDSFIREMENLKQSTHKPSIQDKTQDETQDEMIKKTIRKMLKKIQVLGDQFQDNLATLKKEGLTNGPSVEFIQAHWDKMIILVRQDFIKPLEEIVKFKKPDPKANQANLDEETIKNIEKTVQDNLKGRFLAYYEISNFFIKIQDYYNAAHYFERLEHAFNELRDHPGIDLDTAQIIKIDNDVNTVKAEVTKLKNLMIDSFMSKASQGSFLMFNPTGAQEQNSVRRTYGL
jgi:hypothetical protein